MSEKLKNWAGNLEYSTTNIFYPTSVEALQDIVRQHDKIKVIGSRHSFNRIADSTTALVSLSGLDKVVSLDSAAKTVTIEAGLRYGELCDYLDAQGFAIHNMASLPHISVVGACATATHGSGITNGNLATIVSAIEFIAADGELVTVTRDDQERLNGMAVGLGAFGVVTKVTLDILPRFDMRQDVYFNLPLEQVKNHFHEIMSNAYSVSLFTTWQHEYFEQVWIKSRINDDNWRHLDDTFYEALRSTEQVRPVGDGLPAEQCTQQLGVVGSWQDRLPHFRMNFTPSHGEELQSEYFVPMRHASAAVQAISDIGEYLAPSLLISEVRTIAADNLWMSPCYQQDSVAFHFTWERNWEAVKHILPHIERQLMPFGMQPHWGKVFTMSPESVTFAYEKTSNFRELCERYDPYGKFRNAFLESTIFG